MAFQAAAGPALAREELSCKHLPRLFSTFLQKHIIYHHLNDELRARTINNYVKRLDPSKTLYLPEEVDALKKENADLKERIARQKTEIAQQEQGERELSEDFDELQRQEALTCAENADLKAEITRQRTIIARWEGWSKSQTSRALVG